MIFVAGLADPFGDGAQRRGVAGRPGSADEETDVDRFALGREVGFRELERARGVMVDIERDEGFFAEMRRIATARRESDEPFDLRACFFERWIAQQLLCAGATREQA